ncbi:KIR protein [Plasmodium coatneyi]|uniref:KIR protein n=1 Tax=Plasmodium coatneyi TaxID=208452 RepID=A0A1B1DWB4_9APIC|nr:KIR protein [Plasmodium coatneyi]ANQ07072.1 KIR protein [Plasmodium coatneyi]
MMDPGSLPLPSEERYKEFEERSDCQETQGRAKCNHDIKTKVRWALEVGNRKKWLNDMTLAKKIVRNCSYACMVDTSDEDYYKPCHFLYYWISREVKKGVQNPTTFQTVMNAMFTHLGRAKFWSGCTNVCTNLYNDNMSLNIFNWSNTLFDYEYNYNYIIKNQRSNDYCSSAKYTGQLTKAKEAYSGLCKNCGSSGDKYCEEFKGRYMKNGVCNPEELPKITCPKEEKTLSDSDSEEQSDDDGTGPEGILGEEEELDALKSKLPYYEKLDNGSTGCGNDSSNIVTVIENTINSYTAVRKNAEEIVSAWCYTYDMKNKGTPHNNYCDFLYYWIGSTVLNGQWNVYELGKLMGEIYQKLTQWKAILGCNNMYTNIRKETFNHRKEVFEHFQKYKIMKTQLTKRMGGSSSNMRKCTKAYDTYLKEVIKALGDEYTKCNAADKKNANDPYCIHFLAMCKECNPKDLSNLKCEVPKELEHQTTQTSQTQSQASSAGIDGSTPSTADPTIPAAVMSGGLATIGIPAIAFFLYKVITRKNMCSMKEEGTVETEERKEDQPLDVTNLTRTHSQKMTTP